MYWLNRLEKRNDSGTKRQLQVQPEQAIDFYSNDYLGLTKNKLFQNSLMEMVLNHPNAIMGSTGARLVSGNSNVKNSVEEIIAKIHGYDSALLFPSGYLANLALYSCIAHRHDYVFVDEQVHRSILDGFKLAGVSVIKFKHNDLNHLNSLLQKYQGTIWVVLESLYSMGGDVAPLQDIVQLCQRYQAKLMVDEAHAFAVFGLGFVSSQNLQEQVFACTITYGKAMGLHGAAVLGSKPLKEYLINFATPFVYSTALPDYHFKSIEIGYRFLQENPQLANALFHNIQFYQENMSHKVHAAIGPIQPVLIPSTSKLLEIKKHLFQNKLLTYAMLPPAVAADKQCLRICLHATHTEQEIKLLIDHLSEYL